MVFRVNTRKEGIAVFDGLEIGMRISEIGIDGRGPYLILYEDPTIKPVGSEKLSTRHTIESINKTTIRILSEKLGMVEESIRLEKYFIKDLRVDSLSQVDIIMALEDEFDIEITDEDAEKLSTVKNLLEYLYNRLI